ncbi:hypothetical protein BDV96DRAFT_301878 [Lophiotrema nucula]|uniref:Transmembrane protein n=1 Tax=Lophiotrema nucula TaxID=690887 RepID=A0A6A5YKH2_9PLEO|nr:hypothetical protein BDV96DRAFT_301878 [Lophiotrema nucula]
MIVFDLVQHLYELRKRCWAVGDIVTHQLRGKRRTSPQLDGYDQAERAKHPTLHPTLHPTTTSALHNLPIFTSTVLASTPVSSGSSFSSKLGAVLGVLLGLLILGLLAWLCCGSMGRTAQRSRSSSSTGRSPSGPKRKVRARRGGKPKSSRPRRPQIAQEPDVERQQAQDGGQQAGDIEPTETGDMSEEDSDPDDPSSVHEDDNVMPGPWDPQEATGHVAQNMPHLPPIARVVGGPGVEDRAHLTFPSVPLEGNVPVQQLWRNPPNPHMHNSFPQPMAHPTQPMAPTPGQGFVPPFPTAQAVEPVHHQPGPSQPRPSGAGFVAPNQQQTFNAVEGVPMDAGISTRAPPPAVGRRRNRAGPGKLPASTLMPFAE